MSEAQGASVGPDKIPSFEFFSASEEQKGEGFTQEGPTVCRDLRQGQGGGTAASERNAGRLRAHSHGAEANPRADVVEDASPFYELLEVRVS